MCSSSLVQETCLPDLCQDAEHLVGGSEVAEVALSRADAELYVGEHRSRPPCLHERNEGIRVTVPPPHWNRHVRKAESPGLADQDEIVDEGLELTLTTNSQIV